MKAIDRLLQRWRIDKAVPYVPQGARVLDIGCGDGRLFRTLDSRIRDGIGIEPLLAGPRHAGRWRLLPGRFPERVPPGEKFDAITFIAVLEHFPAELLEECGRICHDLLRPEGVVIVTIPSQAVDGILRVLRRLRLVEAETLEEHHCFDPGRTEEVFSVPNYRLIRKERFQLGLNNLYIFQRKAAAWSALEPQDVEHKA